jgi:acetylglutamate kinase
LLQSILKVLVHGGGKSAKMAQSIVLVPEMIDGRRITDAAMFISDDLCKQIKDIVTITS